MFICRVIFLTVLLFILVCACVCWRTHVWLCVRLPQGLCSGAPSVALRGLKPICLSAARNADRHSSSRLTQSWDWEKDGGGENGWMDGWKDNFTSAKTGVCVGGTEGVEGADVQ